MIYNQNDLLKLILDTQAVSIWDRERGPVFWYAANVPGPFYVNTERVVGRALSEHLLREITAIVAGTVDVEVRAEQLTHLILEAFKAEPAWQKLIATMVDHANKVFPQDGYTCVSGGERRDWIFSIPFAHVINKQHLFLFKNETLFCKQPLAEGEHVLHVSDLINNASSYFDLWAPALERAKLVGHGNVCVNVRGDKGIKKLHDVGQRVVSLMTIDVDFFRLLHAEDLIARETFEEIAIFFASAEDWGAKYLLENPALFNAAGCDAKSFERLKHFVAHDPWNMRAAYKGSFALLEAGIAQRDKSA